MLLAFAKTTRAAPTSSTTNGPPSLSHVSTAQFRAIFHSTSTRSSPPPDLSKEVSPLIVDRSGTSRSSTASSPPPTTPSPAAPSAASNSPTFCQLSRTDHSKIKKPSTLIGYQHLGHRFPIPDPVFVTTIHSLYPSQASTSSNVTR